MFVKALCKVNPNGRHLCFNVFWLASNLTYNKSKLYNIKVWDYSPCLILCMIFEIAFASLEVVVQRCSVKRCSSKLACNFIKKETRAQVFSCEFCEISKNTFSPATLLKKRLGHRCFPVNFVKILRTPFLIEHLWRLLLASWDIGQYVYCNYLLFSLWSNKFWN